MLKLWLIFCLALGVLIFIYFSHCLDTIVIITEDDENIIIQQNAFEKYPIAHIWHSERSYNNNITYEVDSETKFEYEFDYDKLLNEFKLNKSSFFNLPFVASVYRTKVIFRSISDFVWAPQINNVKAENVKCSDILFIKTDYIKKFLETIHPNIKYPYILLTHESDYAVGYPWQLEYLNESKIITWYGQNVIARHPKLKPIPIGIVPPSGENFKTIYDLARNNIPYFNRSLLLYSSFSKNTNKNRTKVLNYFTTTFGKNPLIKMNQVRSKWKEYLLNLGNAQFVLSPPGNGIDCHRTWEALVMGSVPIVLQNDLQPLYDNMPVMVVNNWEEVTIENLEKFKADKLKNLGKDGIPLRPNIWLRYWINELRGAKQNYVQKFC